MTKQFSIIQERQYYCESPKTYKEESGTFVETLMSCTAGPNWRDYFHGKDVLELGAGECTYVPYLLTKAEPATYIASDIFEHRYAAAEKVLCERFGNLEFRVLRADKIEVPEDSFNTILAFGLYHHLPDLEKAFINANKMLRPGGTLILRDPYAGNPALYLKYLFTKRSPNEWPLSIFKTTRALLESAFLLERVARFWLRFPYLPSGPWSTNLAVVARKTR